MMQHELLDKYFMDKQIIIYRKSPYYEATKEILDERRKLQQESPLITIEQVKSTWNYKTGHMDGIKLP
jgi:hypothetical protein